MLPLVRQQHSLRILSSTKQVVRLASTQPAATATSHNNGDNRIETIRRVLFESPQRPATTTPLEGEALEQHNTIERAWKLHTMRERERKQRTLEKQFRSLHQAMSELEKTSDRLFKGAIVKSRHITYPKQAKIPTETPSAQGWDYAYKAPTDSTQ